jgi:DNA-binding NarL/FixJ family response regulator
LDTSTTVMRNVAILEAVLSGQDYASCAKIFNISVATIANSLRTTLKLLKEHTDIDIAESSSVDYLLLNCYDARIK